MLKFDIGILTYGDAHGFPKLLYVDNQMKYFQNILTLSCAFGIKTAMFGLADFEIQNGKPTSSAMFWNGEDFVVDRAEIPQIIDNVSSISQRWFDNISQEACRWLKTITPMHGRAPTKLQTMRALNCCGLADFAIPTWEFTTYEEFLRLIGGKDELIVKPSYGREGQGVVYIDCKADKVFYNCQGECGQLTREAWDSLCAMYPQYNRYLLQKRMDFHAKDGRALDFRVLVLKGDEGRWTVSSSHAKLGATKYISNVWNGGSLGYTKSVLELEFPERADEYYETLMSLGVLIPTVLENFSNSQLSSFGLDIGFDRKSGNAYLIEANSFPGAVPPWPMSETRVRYYRYLLHKNKEQ